MRLFFISRLFFLCLFAFAWDESAKASVSAGAMAGLISARNTSRYGLGANLGYTVEGSHGLSGSALGFDVFYLTGSRSVGPIQETMTFYGGGPYMEWGSKVLGRLGLKVGKSIIGAGGLSFEQYVVGGSLSLDFKMSKSTSLGEEAIYFKGFKAGSYRPYNVLVLLVTAKYWF